MGVRYLVEGSVQRSEDRVRINAKLVDAPTGYNLWAEKFDRKYADLFSLQDEVTSEIADALKVEMTLEERRAIAKHHTENLEAYDLFLRAWERYWQFNDESRRQARQLLNEALALDPKFVRAQALLAATYTNQVGSSLQQSDQSLERAFALAQQAVEIDGDLPQVHWVLGLVYMFRRNFKAAEKSIRTAIKLDPNFADAYALLCWNLQYAGEPERGLEAMEVAMRLNPRAPFPYLNAKSEAYFSLGDYESAVATASQALQLNPAGQRLRVVMAASLAQLGRTDDAQWEIQELLIHEPEFNLKAVRNIAPYGKQTTLDRLLDGLRRAGLPE